MKEKQNIKEKNDNINENENNNHSKRTRIILIVLISIILISILSIMFYLYTDNYYVDDEKILPMTYGFETNNPAIFTEDENGTYTCRLKNSKSNIGLIFYPGGKIDPKAYLNLGLGLANHDIITFITPMPFNLAVFNPYAADDIINNHPEIDTWYIAGHSLGGSMASIYTSKNEDKIKGLILLASYSTSKINNTKVLSIYGTEDKVLNLEKYQKYKHNISNNLIQKIITGANHAYFGTYGEQKGDGKAKIDNRHQIMLTISIISNFIYDKL